METEIEIFEIDEIRSLHSANKEVFNWMKYLLKNFYDLILIALQLLKDFFSQMKTLIGIFDFFTESKIWFYFTSFSSIEGQFFTFERGIWDLLSRLTFWKFDKLEKEKSRAREDFLEQELSEDTAETPGMRFRIARK